MSLLNQSDHLKIKKKGTYLVSAEVNPGFLTKTTQGHKRQNKKGLKGAISCFHYDIRGKAAIVAATGEKGFSRKAGHPLEIIPLRNPDSLKEGDPFPLKVLFEGKPLSGVYLEATYAGFPSQEVSFGHKMVAVSFAHKVQTDKLGETVIKLVKKGSWMVKVNHKIPYPNPEKCDEYSYSTTLTFEVK